MKNEDRAKKIANNCSTHIVGTEVSDETYITTEPDCYRAAIEMAKWKDTKFKQQLIEYRNKVIKEVCNWLRESTNFSSYGQLVIRKNYRHKEDFIKQLEKAIKSKL